LLKTLARASRRTGDSWLEPHHAGDAFDRRCAILLAQPPNLQFVQEEGVKGGRRERRRSLCSFSREGQVGVTFPVAFEDVLHQPLLVLLPAEMGVGVDLQSPLDVNEALLEPAEVDEEGAEVGLRLVEARLLLVLTQHRIDGLLVVAELVVGYRQASL
jgi:hypothetical protein